MRGAIFDVFDYFAGEISLEFMVMSVFSVLVVILLCFPVHECAHAFVAHLLGDDTASDMGRLTLNPLVHVDPVGALCIFIANIGWAKPTPVSLHRCRKVSIRTADILVSAAGPVSNFLLALIMVIIAKIIVRTAEPTDTMGWIIFALYQIAEINTYLMIINLIPVPPFDGYALIQGILPRKQAIWIEQNARIINLVVFILFVSRVLTIPLMLASNGVMWLIDLMTFFI